LAVVLLAWSVDSLRAQPAGDERAALQSRISELESGLAALEKERFQHRTSIEAHEKKIEEAQAVIDELKPWEAALAAFRTRLDEKERAYDQARERYYDIPPEDRSWLDSIYLGFIKAPQRRIPRSASRLYDMLAAQIDRLTFHRTIAAELRAGITLEGGLVVRRFDGVEDFVRQVDAAALRAGLAADDCLTSRNVIAAAQRRLTLIDAEQQRLRREIDELKRRLERLHDDAPPAERTAVAPALAQPEIVDAVCSQLEGPAGGRVAVWRFYILVALRSDAVVELKLLSITREPPAQDPDPRRRFPTPTRAFTLRPGDTFQLGGWEGAGEGVPVLEDVAEPNPADPYDQPRVSARRHLGPYYLTVWEEQGFQGRFVAEFETVRGTAEVVRLRAEFAPPPPPTSQAQMTIDEPAPDKRTGQADAVVPGFAWHDKYHLRLVVHVPDLPPGEYRLRVQARGGRDRFVWARAREGEARTTFWGFVPVEVGPYEFTLTLPEAPQVAPATIAGRIDPARGSVEGLDTSLRAVQQAAAAANAADSRTEPYLRQWWLGDALLTHAQRLNLAGRFDEALQAAEQAINLLPEYEPGRRHASGSGSNYQNLAWHEKAIALYHLGQREAFYEAMQHIARMHLKLGSAYRDQGNESVARDYERRAGECYHLLAHRLLMLGADIKEVRRLVAQGNQYYAQAQKTPPKLNWLPE